MALIPQPSTMDKSSCWKLPLPMLRRNCLTQCPWKKVLLQAAVQEAVQEGFQG